MKEEQNLTRQKLEDALTQKTESVENVQKLLAEKAGMMMELGELKGIRSQIETQIQSANTRAERMAKECETEGRSERFEERNRASHHRVRKETREGQ